VSAPSSPSRSPRVILGDPTVRLPVTTSTMDEVERYAREGAAEGLVVVADYQTAGRGRAGRSWTAPPGTALLCSFLLRPPLSPDRLSTLPLIVGVAVAEAIEDCAPVRCQLKWPNDVWIGGHKVAGVLMKASSAAGEVGYAALGVGINVSGEIAGLPAGATSVLAASASEVDRSRLLRRLVGRLQAHYDRFLRADGRPDLTSWRERAALLDEVVAVEDAGSRVIGRFVRVDPDGALLLDVGGALRRIVSGDLTRGPVVARS
jgi:BirA family biotin operon repressor/biotin-[acetyl-CoA-carboxylase] ligase